MTIRNFIFSERRSDRIKRHLLFWFFYLIFLTFLHAASPTMKFPYAALYSFSLLVPQVFFTYALISFVLPKYLLRSKYLVSLLWIISFVIATAVLNYVMLRYVNPFLRTTIWPEQTRREFIVTGPGLFMDLIVCFKGTLVAAAGACSIRLVKHWHLKEKRSTELLKEKTEAQLQLLRAQVHPHFLFNTLNNIYSKAQNESPGSAKMIMELSHILRYVLDEGKHVFVPLEKELQMITDYINLEKMRYDDRLELHISIPSNADGVSIAPLLLLPFVENCFKHGNGNLLNNPWINLKIELDKTILTMKLMNGKITSRDIYDSHSAIGIGNVRKRLDLLYKEKYDLQINEDDEVFVVNLVVQLEKETGPAIVTVPLQAPIQYA